MELNKPTLPPPGAPLPPPQRPQQSGSSGTLTFLKILAGVLFVALLGSFYTIYTMWNEVKEMQTENIVITGDKDVALEQLESLKAEYSDLRTSNDTLNAQLNAEKKKIDILIAKIKKTDSNNKFKLKGYEQEISDLKALLKDYVKQIDELSTENKALRAENDQVKQTASERQKQVDELAKETGNLKDMVEKGAALKIRDFNVTALSNRDKVVTKARQVAQLRVCVTLVENSIAKTGPRKVYIRVKAPDGSLLTQSAGNLFDAADGGAQLIYSGMREVDYAGQDLEVCVFYKDTEYSSGNYSVEAYLDGSMVGSSQLVLK